MKKRIVWLIAVTLLLAGFGAYHWMKDPYANLEVFSDDIDWDRPRTVLPLDRPEQLVVIGTFTGKRELYQRTIKGESDYEPDMQITRTKSMVKVERVLKLGADRERANCSSRRFL